MKIKFSALCFFYLLVLSFSSCASSSIINRGIINPDNLSEEDLITLYVDKFTFVNSINDINVNWKMAIGPLRDQIVKIPSGMYTFLVQYQSGEFHSVNEIPVTAQLESGNTYFMRNKRHVIARNIHTVTYHIYLYNDNTLGEEVTITKE